jgi:hypothetical protein
MREDGIVVLVFITYSNTYTYNTNNLRYQYSARLITDAEFKTEQAIYTKNPTNRGNNRAFNNILIIINIWIDQAIRILGS